MAISSTDITSGPFVTNGATTSFSFSFRVADYGDVEAEDMVKVVLVVAATGVETVLTRGVSAGQYTVTLNGDQDSSPGGSITTVTTYAAGYYIYIRLKPTFKQQTELTSQSGYNGPTHEAQYDELQRQILDIRDQVRRAPVMGVQAGESFDGYVGKSMSDNVGRAIVVNADGDGFDFGGNNFDVTATGSTTARSLADRFGDVVNVLDFGAVGNGVTDDTTAINAANTYAVAGARALYFPGGYTFLYTGTGLTGSAMRLIGDGISQSVIVLGAGKYLVDDSALWGSLYMSGLRIVDGAGAVRSTYTSTMVQLTFQINDCYFYGYTGACISNNSSDNPHWHIENCIFWGGDDSTCVGIALKGLTDSNVIQHNTFRKNKVAIKLGDGGNNAYIDFNDFVQYDGGSGRVAIHVVPDADGTNAGTGLYVGPGNKFGNENLDSSDFRIVYADELSGTYFGDRLPDMSTNSTGYIRGHHISGAFIGGGSNPQQPLIKSMTKRVFGCSYTNIAIGGTPPTYILEFSETPDALTASDPEWNLIGPVVFDGFEADDLASFAVASSYVSTRIADPAGTLARLSSATAAAAFPFIAHGTWTPAITFATPGDLAVATSVATGFYTQVGYPGAGFVIASFNITTSSFTHTTASGNLLVSGLPVAHAVASGILSWGAGRLNGVTKANYTNFSAFIGSGATNVGFVASGSAQTNSLVTAADTPTGGTVNLSFQVTYRI